MVPGGLTLSMAGAARTGEMREISARAFQPGVEIP
jgi:hypothetical protein